MQSKVDEFKGFRSTLSANLSVEDFMKILKKKEELINVSSKIGSYAGLWQTENTADSKRNAHESKISELSAKAENEIIFFSVWFKDLSDTDAAKFISGSAASNRTINH